MLPTAIAKRIDLNAGMPIRSVEMTPTKAIAIAANGNASSSETIAAVPNPCAHAPTANPLAIGSLTPIISRIFLPKLAPSSPVNTTTEATSDAGEPRIPAMATASGAVTILGSRTSTMSCGAPTRRPSTAVPTMLITDARNVEPKMARACCCISFRRAYICSAKDTTAGPKNSMRRSPGPDAAPNPPVKYVARMAMKASPFISARPWMPKNVTRVHVMSGWTTDLMFGGSICPTENPKMVWKSMNA
mmetsp:Transcript_6981/g.17112  ORF Transcript_6981/g.17112 Transcript_6981/m.17112 type:complete len:246 (+) Transcript_6981:4210-4947(+)